MSKDTLKGRRIAILATDGFEQSELLKPKQLLEEAGATVVVVAPGGKQRIKGWNHGEWGDPVPVSLPLNEARISDYDAVVLPGGVINPDQLRLHEAAIAFVREFGHTGRPLAAICHGPWTLINAGLVEGRHVTSWPSLRVDLENAGAKWEDGEVIVDGNLITSRNPGDIPAFVRTLIRQLEERQAQAA